MSTLSQDAVYETLRQVKDPELDIDIVTLGLVRHVEMSDRDGIDVIMTLTSALCPFGEKIIGTVESVLAELHPEVRVELTFEPPWEPPEEVKLMLGV